MAAPSLILSHEELVALTGYRRPAEQLKALHARGFARAWRNRLGQVVLERAHYDAVCSRAGAANDPAAGRPRPVLRSLQR
jgi:hypothetical protein